MTPFEVVLQHYRFPSYIKPHVLQVETINDLAPLSSSGHWLGMGAGKTFTSTACALYHKVEKGHQAVAIMPPVLVAQWGRWLRSITPSLSVTEYQGTPAQRRALSLEADFVLVGIQIFKRDYKRFVDHYSNRPTTLIVDEATSLSNIRSDNHQMVFEFSSGHARILLTGTPANNPMDAYGLMKFTAPGVYRNWKAFESAHVEERDFYDNPVKFKDLDVLKVNLGINSKRILLEDMYSETEEPLFVPLEYRLDPAHYKLYRKLAEEELLALPDGGKIDATSANKLLHALGQIIVNWNHFSGDPKHVAESVKMVQEKLDELGGEKLVVFANYRMTVANLVGSLKEYGAVALNSQVSQTEKEKAIQRFLSDPSCKVIIIQFRSGGYGLDGLQHVCNHALFVEVCQQPRDFHQCVARLKRLGQLKRVVVMLAMARGTLQIRGFNKLLANDTIVNQVIRNSTELRKAVFGE